MHKQLVFKYYITQAQPTIMHLVILGVWLSVSLVCLFSSICCPQIAPKLVYSIKSTQIVPRLCGVCCYRYMLQVGAVGPPTPKLACFTHLARTPSSISLLVATQQCFPSCTSLLVHSCSCMHFARHQNGVHIVKVGTITTVVHLRQGTGPTCTWQQVKIKCQSWDPSTCWCMPHGVMAESHLLEQHLRHAGYKVWR